MEIPQIKDKVTARAFALQMAYGAFHSEGGILGTAEKYANFIIGDAELPEVYRDPLTTPFTWTTEPIQPLTVSYRHESDSQQL